MTVVDTLPAELVFVSATPAPSSVSGQTLTWNLGTLAAGATGTISVQVRSLSSAADGTVVVNTATIATASPGDDPDDNSSSASTTLQRADVQIIKSSPDSFPVLSGQSITYYLDYRNAGPACSGRRGAQRQAYRRSWRASAGPARAGAAARARAAASASAWARWRPRDGGRVTVTGTATTSAGREDFTNTAAISTSTPETDTANNQSSADGAVWTADLQIVARPRRRRSWPAMTFTATLRYANSGPALASAAVLTDTLPAGVTLVAAAPPRRA